MEERLREWLKSEMGMQARSSRDVVNRIKRVKKITGFNLEKTDYDEIIENLNNNVEFNNLSMYVKPQIKRAISLYKKFLQEQEKSN